MAGDVGQRKAKHTVLHFTGTSDADNPESLRRLGINKSSQRATKFPHGGKSERGRRGKKK